MLIGLGSWRFWAVWLLASEAPHRGNLEKWKPAYLLTVSGSVAGRGFESKRLQPLSCDTSESLGPLGFTVASVHHSGGRHAIFPAATGIFSVLAKFLARLHRLMAINFLRFRNTY
jgi:hypothetical protein